MKDSKKREIVEDLKRALQSDDPIAAVEMVIATLEYELLDLTPRERRQLEG